MATMLLAGDVGGTKAMLGLYAAGAGTPVPRVAQRFTTLAFDGLAEMVGAFLRASGWSGPLDAACFGVAGPVRGRTAPLTNVPWLVDADDLGRRFPIGRVRLLNDLAAMAHAVPALAGDQLAVLQRGNPDPHGNAALIAPGTGLGEALLHRVGDRLVAVASEAGHADFAARTSREAALQRALTDRFRTRNLRAGHLGTRARQHTRVHPRDVELPPGPGRRPRAGVAGIDLPGRPRPELPRLRGDDGPVHRRAGRGSRQPRVAVDGDRGRLSGRGNAIEDSAGTADGDVLDAFRAKAPMNALVEAMPVSVILEPDAALLGAAIAALESLADGHEA